MISTVFSSTGGGKLPKEDVQFDVAAFWAKREGEIEAPQEQSPRKLVKIEWTSRWEVGKVFMSCPDHE